MKHTMMMRWARGFAGMLLAATLASCGGGGGGGCNKYEGCDPATTPEAPAALQPATVLLNLSESSVKNSDQTPVVATATVVNAQGQAMQDVPVVFSVTGALYSGGLPTNATGKSVASVDYTTDKTNRVVTVRASVGSVYDEKTFLVSGVKITTTLLPAIVTAGTNNNIVEVTVADANSTGIDGLQLNISGLEPVSVITSGGGKYTYTYNVPLSYSASNITFTFAAGGVSQQQVVTVQQPSSPVVIPAAVGPVGAATLDASPSVVETNSDGGSTNQTTVSLKVVGTQPSPLAIPNVRVSFDLAGDPLQVGGRFTSGSTPVYTSNTGVASTSYIPGTKSTGTNQLVVRACYSLTDFVPDPTGGAVTGSPACPNAALLPMTINDEALNITIGPDALVETIDDGLRYRTRFVVQVANASGQAKSNVLITPTLDLTGYEKGVWDKPGGTGDWEQFWTLPANTTYPDRDVPTEGYEGCANEDANRDGIRSPGEDTDADVKLEPRKSDAVISFIDPTKTKTDSTGAVGLQVTYLKNVASWLRVKIYVRGTVSGTEGIGTITQVLLPPFEDVKGEGEPAFATNPYGAGTTCTSHN